jgi:RNA polymerase sigma factor (sigma-70 family)
MSPPDDDSLARLIAGARAGRPEAQERLWQRFFARLVAFAETRLRGRPPRGADAEDAALSALHSFYRGAKQGRYPRLDDPGNLWPLLVQMTANKAANLLRTERAQKRGAGGVQGESAFGNGARGIEQIVCQEPTPDFAVQVEEECQRLLGALDEPSLRQVATWRMEGHSNEEIAARLGCKVRTVERKLRSIREIWAEERGARE